jgi:hypothetical protein
MRENVELKPHYNVHRVTGIAKIIKEFTPTQQQQ